MRLYRPIGEMHNLVNMGEEIVMKSDPFRSGSYRNQRKMLLSENLVHSRSRTQIYACAKQRDVTV